MVVRENWELGWHIMGNFVILEFLITLLHLQVVAFAAAELHIVSKILVLLAEKFHIFPEQPIMEPQHPDH